MDADENQEFLIEGPMGKGLDLSAENISGNNIIFLGGTGVLPFVDLFAYFARMLINEKSPGDNIQEGEEFDKSMQNASFTVFAYYPRESEGVALELCTKISELYEHFGMEEKFKFSPVFTREGGTRLTKDSIYEVLNPCNISNNLKNVWVCGPPPMNNMFQRLRKELQKEY